MEIIYINSLQDAEEKLNKINANIYISNSKGSIKYLGINLIDIIFKKLKTQHSNIKKTILNIDDNSAYIYQAVELGYKDIIYTGNSDSVKKLIDKYQITQFCNL